MPTDKQVRDAIKAIILTVSPNAVVHNRWVMALIDGEQANILRRTDGKIQAWMISRLSASNTRVGPVPYSVEASRIPYKRESSWTYRIRFVYQFDESNESNSSEDQFNAEIETVTNAIGLSPKLGLGVSVEGHSELQVQQIAIPAYGRELGHTADCLLTVNLYQAVQP
jgi:hypothetical protein